MKIGHSAGPNKGQRRDSWVIVDREGTPHTWRRALMVYPCRRDADSDCDSDQKPVKLRYNHLQYAYKRNGDKLRKKGEAMRATCPSCDHNFDIPHREVLKQVDRLKNKRAGKQAVDEPDVPDVDGNIAAPKARPLRLPDKKFGPVGGEPLVGKLNRR